MIIGWSEFKSKSVYKTDIQGIENSSKYILSLQYGNEFYECLLKKDDPDIAADIIDFEDNYKSFINGYPSLHSGLANMEGKYPFKKGKKVLAIAGATTRVCLKFSQDVLLSSGRLRVTGKIFDGDYIKILITDEDNYFGQGAGYILKEMGQTIYLDENLDANGNVIFGKDEIALDIPTSGMTLFTPCYVSIDYVSVGQNNIKCNLEVLVWA